MLVPLHPVACNAPYPVAPHRPCAPPVTRTFVGFRRPLPVAPRASSPSLPRHPAAQHAPSVQSACLGASLLLSRHLRVASPSPPDASPSPSHRLPVTFFVASPSSPSHPHPLPITSPSLPHRLPVASPSPACHLPVASLSPPRNLRVASLPVAPSPCYPITTPSTSYPLPAPRSQCLEAS
ncbi:unnamed protein product [Closterium sp. NIES-54]